MQETLIETIRPYPKNAKKHPKKQIKQIANSIREFGFSQPIVTDKAGVIIVGHGRYEAAKLLGLKKVPVIKTDLTKEKAKAYRLTDNKLNESDWDMDLLIEELKGLSETMIDLTGFSTDLILDSEPKDDDVPDIVKGSGKVKLGDIYQLGDHRVMCGDSTKKEEVELLMHGEVAQMCFTDPPYNVNYEGGITVRGTNKARSIQNDNMSSEQFYQFLHDACKNILQFTRGGIYICMSSSEINTLKVAYETAGGHWQSFIIWVKNNFTMSRADYQNTYEPILYGWPKEEKNHFFVGDRNIANVWEDLRAVKTDFKDGYTTISFQGFKIRLEGEVKKGEIIRKKQRTDIWRHNKPHRSKEHPTMKPVVLCLEAIRNSSKENDIVLDLFLGSGSTLIAAEKAERICYGMELDPRYVEVIIQRWEEYTDSKAEKIS